MERIVVEKSELLDAGLLRQRQRLLIRGVAETGMRLVLLRRVLRVVHEQVGVAAPVREILHRSVGAVGEQRDLVVGRKRETRGALVDAVTESRDRMHQEMRRDAQRADLERLAWVPLDELHL